MSRIEWINLLALVVAVAAGGAYIGQLRGTLDSLDPDEVIGRVERAGEAALGQIAIAHEGLPEELVGRIERAGATALGEIERANAGLSSLGNLHSDRFDWVQGSSAVQMIRVSEGICYLVHVAGIDDGDYVSINARDEFWFLEGRARAGGARARCWKFPFSGPSGQPDGQ